MREPRALDLIAFVCRLQPELDERSAARLIALDEGVQDMVTQFILAERQAAESLLELHLEIDGAPA